MKEIILGILGVILFIVIVLAILFHKTLSQFRKMLKQAADAREARRIAEEEEYFKRTSTKHYRKDEEAPKFKDDYFKSSNTEGRPKQKQRTGAPPHDADGQRRHDYRRPWQPEGRTQNLQRQRRRIR